MSKYKVTIKVTETYTCEVDEAVCESDAIATALSERYAWLYDGCDEYYAKAEEVDE